MTRMVRNHRSARLTGATVLLTLFGFAGGTAHASPMAHGTSRTGNVALTDPNTWQTILSISLASSNHGHTCQAVASLDALNPQGNNPVQNYFFTIALDNANPPLGAFGVERSIELRDNAGVNDVNFWPVSTNTLIALTAGSPHTVRLLGRKAFGAPNLVVDDAVLSMICI